ncbi:MAG: hypothetical protein ACOYYU_05225 [Chloroflexota bacterium]
MKKLWIFGLLLMGLSACGINVSAESAMLASKPAASLPDLGPAPELTNDTWLNVDAPLRLANLRGKVVLIDMWTFG